MPLKITSQVRSCKLPTRFNTLPSYRQPVAGLRTIKEQAILGYCDTLRSRLHVLGVSRNGSHAFGFFRSWEQIARKEGRIDGLLRAAGFDPVTWGQLEQTDYDVVAKATHRQLYATMQVFSDTAQYSNLAQQKSMDQLRAQVDEECRHWRAQGNNIEAATALIQVGACAFAMEQVDLAHDLLQQALRSVGGAALDQDNAEEITTLGHLSHVGTDLYLFSGGDLEQVARSYYATSQLFDLAYSHFDRLERLLRDMRAYLSDMSAVALKKWQHTNVLRRQLATAPNELLDDNT